MNPIENLWGWLARRVYLNNKQYNNIDELKAAIKKEWKLIDLGFLKTLIGSMSTRIFDFTKANGSYTIYTIV